MRCEALRMPNYRRAWVAGGCWFFTVNLLDRCSTQLIERIDALRDATQWTLQHYPFQTDAFVVLPDHIHAVWTLPAGDTDFATRWRMIKSRFARSMPKLEYLSAVRSSRGERGVWQRRFWEHLIRDESDYAHHIEYCYINPVKHGLVRRVQDWPYSSFHRDVRAGIFPADWAGKIEIAGKFGERP
jgi:putative transposase